VTKGIEVGDQLDVSIRAVALNLKKVVSREW